MSTTDLSRLLPCNSALLLDNGREWIVRLGAKLPPVWVQQIFYSRDSKTLELAPLDGKASVALRRVHGLLEMLRTPQHGRLRVVREGGADEVTFFCGLIEDRCLGEVSLDEFQQQMMRR